MTAPVVVWFKRDLRVVDHEALSAGVREGPIIPLYVVEPDYWANEFTSGRQWSFLKDSVLSLENELANRGQPLWVEIGHVEEILESLYQRFRFCKIISHQETGPDWTFQRDLRVKRWCEDRGVVWDEYRQHGVIRGLQERQGWAAQWASLMNGAQPELPPTFEGIGTPPRRASDV